MNLENAIKAHAEWKMKFRDAISGKKRLDAAAISADNVCPLGQWLHGEAKATYGKLVSDGNCTARHAAVHKEAGKIAAAINAGRYAEAEAMMSGGTPYSEVSSEVGTAIIKFRKEAKL